VGPDAAALEEVAQAPVITRKDAGIATPIPGKRRATAEPVALEDEAHAAVAATSAGGQTLGPRPIQDGVLAIAVAATRAEAVPDEDRAGAEAGAGAGGQFVTSEIGNRTAITAEEAARNNRPNGWLKEK